MEDRPLVTVYITNYNYGRYVRKAIDSVLSQTMKDIELIIIDDGSTDGSRQIIQEYENIENVQVIFQKNKGLNVSNNIALRSARGRFIVRLDADDYFDKNALLLMSNVLSENEDVGIVFPDYYLIDADDNVIGHERRMSFDEDVSLHDKPAHGACTMIRVKCLKDLGGYSEAYGCQDGYDLWLRFIEKYKVENLNLPLFYYRRHGSNLTDNEHKILKTRAQIKKDFVLNNRVSESMNAVAVIPVRGCEIDPHDIALKAINGMTMLDRVIRSVKDIDDVRHVVVSSPDHDVEEYVKSKYADEKKVKYIKRSRRKAQFNEGLVGTVTDILSEIYSSGDPDDLTILRMSVEYPFMGETYIEKMINTMKIYGVDSVVGVRQDLNLYYTHNGGGLVPLVPQNTFPRLERDGVYKLVGGACLVKAKAFRKNNNFIVGKVGHVVVDRFAAHMINSPFDMKIAEMIVSEGLYEDDRF